MLASLFFYSGGAWRFAAVGIAALFYFFMGGERKSVRIAFGAVIGSGTVLFSHLGEFLALPSVGDAPQAYGAAGVLGVLFTLVCMALGERARGARKKNRTLQSLAYPLLFFLVASAFLTLADRVPFGLWGIAAAGLFAALAGEARTGTDTTERVFHAVFFAFIGFVMLWFAHMLPFTPALGGAFTALPLCIALSLLDTAPHGRKKEFTFILREISTFAIGLVTLLAVAFM